MKIKIKARLTSRELFSKITFFGKARVNLLCVSDAFVDDFPLSHNICEYHFLSRRVSCSYIKDFSFLIVPFSVRLFSRESKIFTFSHTPLLISPGFYNFCKGRESMHSEAGRVMLDRHFQKILLITMELQ